MNTIDRYEAFTLGRAEHRLMFTVKSTMLCEKELASKNLITTIAGLATGPLSIGDAYTLFKWGLLGSKQYKENEIDELFGEYLEEYGMVALQSLIAGAVNKSGLLGMGKNATALPQEENATAAPRS